MHSGVQCLIASSKMTTSPNPRGTCHVLKGNADLMICCFFDSRRGAWTFGASPRLLQFY